MRSDPLLVHLRQQLRASGWTTKKLAQHFTIGEATAKRWLTGQGLTLDRLQQLADLAGTTIAALARDTERPDAGLAEELTLAQERALSEDSFLSFLFITILGGYAPDQIARDFEIAPEQIDAALVRLERLALVDRLSGGRVRPRIDRRIIWRKSPMRTLFETQMKPQFMAMDFAANDAVYASEIVRLSAQGAAMLAELIERHRRDIQALAERDRQDALLPARWYAILSAARPLDTTGLERSPMPSD